MLTSKIAKSLQCILKVNQQFFDADKVIDKEKNTWKLPTTETYSECFPMLAEGSISVKNEKIKHDSKNYRLDSTAWIF